MKTIVIEARCQHCGDTERATRPVLDKAGWTWFTGWRAAPSFWCQTCRLTHPNEFKADMRDAYTSVDTEHAKLGIVVPFAIGLRKHPHNAHTWMVEGLVLNDVSVHLGVSTPSMSCECKQQIIEYIIDAVNEKRWRTMEGAT